MLESRHVFLDTEVFVSAGFNFAAGSTLARLADVAREGRIAVHVTDVVVAEVQNRIEVAISDAQAALMRARGKARALRNVGANPVPQLFDDFDLSEAEKELQKSLEMFLESSRANVISTEGVSILDVLEDHHRTRPPFGEGKKNEFPDAFTCRALKRWCGETGEKLYVVSRDADLARVCKEDERLVLVESVAEVLEELLRLTEPGLPELAHQVLKREWEGVAKRIGDDFEGLGFVLLDQWGDVLEVIVNGVELLDSSVVGVEEDNVSATLRVQVDFDAELSYDDLETATYDSEDKRLIPWRTIERSVRRTEDIDVGVTILMARDNPAAGQVEDVSVEATDIEVNADEWEERWWD